MLHTQPTRRLSKTLVYSCLLGVKSTRVQALLLLSGSTWPSRGRPQGVKLSREGGSCRQVVPVCYQTVTRDSGTPLDRTGLTMAQHQMAKQALACNQSTSFATKHFRDVRNNRYHPTDNPEGVVDFGLAENKLCADLLKEKMSSIQQLPEPMELFYYEKYVGNIDFRQTMTEFIQRVFNPQEEINVANVYITNGVTVILEAVAFAFADPGDYIMVPSPYYYRTKFDIFERPGVLTLDVPLSYVNDGKRQRYTLEARVLEQVYQEAVSQGKRVRAVMLNNPVNPTGDVIEAAQLTDLLHFAHKYNLHVLSNEIYALSTFDPDVPFTSILSLPHPDPDKVHFAWGVSKDTGLSGYRCGFIHTKNQQFMQYLNNTMIYFRAAGLIQHRLNAFLGDFDYMEQVFIPTMKTRLRDRFQDLRQTLEGFGAEVHPSASTLFVWVNLTKFLPEATFEGEQQLFHKFLEQKVFIVPGQDYSAHVPGWFRICFSVDLAIYEKGKHTLIAVLRSLKAHSRTKSEGAQDEH